MCLVGRKGITSYAATRIMVVMSALLLIATAMVGTVSGQTRDSGVGGACVSTAMIRLLAREGNSVLVSPSTELAAQKDGSFENEKGITLAKEPDTTRTLEEALHWFERGARKGYAPAQVNLAVLSMAGWGTTANAGTAMYWLGEAARQDYALAYFDLGILYLNGCGFRQDYQEAFRQFERGANAGDAAAQMNLGYLYDQGLGVVQDRAEAAMWYRKAAERGLAPAQNNLADLYLRGEGVPRDEKMAFAWFQKAALQGHTGARIMLGSMYAAGRGTEKNLQAAYEWICAAALQGDNRGDETLKALERQLTPNEVAQSRIRAQSLTQSLKAHLDAELVLLH